jgi:hypothetical protein
MFLLKKAQQYLDGLLKELDSKIDKRLVGTFYNLFMVIQTFRNRPMGLVLSELGAFVCGPSHAPAGTKRISNLLRSKKWTSKVVDNFLFERTKKRVEQIKEKGKKVLFIWDDSRIEKAESWFVEGLCSVWSSKAKRLTKIKRGYYFPPIHRICVPGFKWTALLVSAVGEVPSLCCMSWWTTRGKFKELGSNIMYRMLQKCQAHFGSLAVHVLDRGYAKQELIGWMFDFEQHFILRWKKNHNLIHQNGQSKKTHLVARSYKGQGSKLVRDKERKLTKRISIAFAPVRHPEYPDHQLFMVIVRDKNNYNGPMYILTSLPIKKVKDAWEICFSYIHRWNIEQTFRFAKAELAMESPRLWSFENRLKLLAIVALVYDFLISLIRNWSSWIFPFLKNWCHRTGNRYREASIPIYRLRAAVAFCLFFCLAQNSG